MKSQLKINFFQKHEGIIGIKFEGVPNKDIDKIYCIGTIVQISTMKRIGYLDLGSYEFYTSVPLNDIMLVGWSDSTIHTKAIKHSGTNSMVDLNGGSYITRDKKALSYVLNVPTNVVLPRSDKFPSVGRTFDFKNRILPIDGVCGLPEINVYNSTTNITTYSFLHELKEERKEGSIEYNIIKNVKEVYDSIIDICY